jgi:hypothetical protein
LLSTSDLSAVRAAKTAQSPLIIKSIRRVDLAAMSVANMPLSGESGPVRRRKCAVNKAAVSALEAKGAKRRAAALFASDCSVGDAAIMMGTARQGN